MTRFLTFMVADNCDLCGKAEDDLLLCVDPEHMDRCLTICATCLDKLKHLGLEFKHIEDAVAREQAENVTPVTPPDPMEVD
jgi:hypothetical protein